MMDGDTSDTCGQLLKSLAELYRREPEAVQLCAASVIAGNYERLPLNRSLLI